MSLSVNELFQNLHDFHHFFAVHSSNVTYKRKMLLVISILLIFYSKRNLYILRHNFERFDKTIKSELLYCSQDWERFFSWNNLFSPWDNIFLKMSKNVKHRQHLSSYLTKHRACFQQNGYVNNQFSNLYKFCNQGS